MGRGKNIELFGTLYTPRLSPNVPKGIVKCTPLVTADSIYFGSYDHNFYKLDRTGAYQWKINIR